MKKPISCGAVCVAVVLASGCCKAADLYKWTDAQGQVHYGDKPTKGAARLPDMPVQTYTPPRRTERLSPAAQHQVGAETEYSSVSIVNPQADETIWDNTGTLNITARVEPALHTDLGHKLKFLLDGQPAGEPGTDLTTTLSELDRGTHHLSAVVVDGDGKQLAQAPAVEFHIKKISKLQRGGSSAGGK